jgi:trigger factor
MRPQAEQQVKVRLALERIAELEALTVSDEEIEAEYTNISNAYNVPLDEVKKMILADDLKADILVGSAMKFVRENAKIGKAKKAAAKKTTKTAKAEKEEAPAEEKKPARKPRAKKTKESAE